MEVKLTKVDSNIHFNIPKPVFVPKLTEGQLLIAKEYEHFTGLPIPAIQEQQRRELEIELAQAYLKGIDDEANTWISLFDHSMEVAPKTAPEGFKEYSNMVPYHAKAWKELVCCESDFKVYFIDEARYKSTKNGATSERMFFTPTRMKVNLCDLVWLAAVGMYLTSNYLHEPIWFTPRAFFGAVATLVVDHTRHFMDYPMETQAKLLTYVKSWAFNTWNGALAPIDSNIVTRSWLEAVAHTLNAQVGAIDKHGHYGKDTRYSATEDWRGGCDVQMRKEYLEGVKKWLRTEGASLNGAEQRDYIRNALVNVPNFKGSIYSWVVRTLGEEIDESSGETILHPYRQEDDKRCTSSRATSASVSKDYETECIRKEGSVWYFPKKLATNPAFRRWRARKQLEVTFTVKFMKQ